jgi:type I restriction enzyme S subunit
MKLKQLSEVTEVIMGQSPPSNTYNKNNKGLPFFQGKTEFTEKSPVGRKWCSKPIKIAEKGDILLSVRAPVGPVNIANQKCCIGRGIAAIRPKKELLTEYLFYFMLFNEKSIESKGSGSTFKAINKDQVSKIKIPVGPIEEQKRIVSVLERAEKLKEKRKQANMFTKQLPKSLFLKMFGDMDQKSKYPVVELRSVIDIVVPTRDKPTSFTGDIPWITLADITGDLYVNNATFNLSKGEAAITKTRLLPPKTVLLSCAGSLGKIAILKNEAYCNQQFYGLICNEAFLLPEFLAIQLSMHSIDFYRTISGTSTLSFFSKNQALKIRIICPPISFQKKFALNLERIEELSKKQRESEDDILLLFGALMQKSFGGN